MHWVYVIVHGKGLFVIDTKKERIETVQSTEYDFQLQEYEISTMPNQKRGGNILFNRITF